MNPRLTRQSRLAEVGADGTARLSSARASLRTHGDAARYEALYLIGSGIRRLDGVDERLESALRAFDPEAELQMKKNESDHWPDSLVTPALVPAAAALWEGATAALAHIQRVLSSR